MGRTFLPVALSMLGCNPTRADRSAEVDAAPPVTSAHVAPVAVIEERHDAARADVPTEGTARFLIERVDASHAPGQQSKGPYDLLVLLEAKDKKPERRHLHCPPRKRLMWENCDAYKSCAVVDSSAVVCDGQRFVLRTREGKTEAVRGENVELTLERAYDVGEAKSRVRVALVDL
jgi:hypothetical protein